LAGLVEMGLGLIFPLLLILDLGMSPLLAGIALIPTTVPMIVLSPWVGRWYDRAGGRPPLVLGFAVLASSAVALAVGVHTLDPAARDYLALLPGLVLFGSGLALILAVNDPVSLDSVDDRLAGEVTGVSATAEQAGGAIGIAALYAVFHSVYVHRLQGLTDNGAASGLTPEQGRQLGAALQAAEQTGLSPDHFDEGLVRFLVPAFDASKLAYGAVFLVVLALSVLGAGVSFALVGKPRRPVEAGRDPASARGRSVASRRAGEPEQPNERPQQHDLSEHDAAERKVMGEVAARQDEQPQSEEN
jgi:MFS family permease